ncbi:hypothetical protein [Gluconobacter thailandicus]|uniref:Uncharacterized protein n=1 Tax=Gluconobacter thailandicus TaxID=257438 RepID=A0AAP9JHV5_GLUTH|nr:hypothetical protein [Gluconobacter thailandicus]KXV33277.1 hypothetical protein AD940_11550 [Gluconobacter thailandicus]QEH96587.1 hypothetical protein FXF46_09980 [Gluconobacter thailandicus]
MSKLSKEERDSLPDSEFGLPEKRAYPVDTKARARNAKARATQELERGLLTQEERDEIDRAADRKLNED